MKTSQTPLVYFALTHEHRGEPAEVLSLAEQPYASLAMAADQVILRVTHRPIHPGDLHMIRGTPNGGPSAPISSGTSRIPGFEGVGVVVETGATVASKGEFAVGQRVAFIDGGAKAWATHAVMSSTSLVAVPESMPNGVAAQLLINSVTAMTVLRTGHDSLPPNASMPVTVLQSAAGSAVGRLLSRIAMDRGVRLVRLVRSRSSADELLAALAGAPVIVTADPDWKEQVRRQLDGYPVYVAMDAVGGRLINDLADFLQPGGTIVNYGWLGEGTPDLSGFAPRSLSFKGATLGTWWSAISPDERAKDIESFIEIATRAPGLFAVAAEYPLREFRSAISHVTRPGKVGTVLFTS